MDDEWWVCKKRRAIRLQKGDILCEEQAEQRGSFAV
jgi:hypothetical protein